MSFWTLEQRALLTKLHGERGEPSFSVIADAINKEFGTDFSRRACIGKARRIHLPARRPSNQSTFNKQTVGRKVKQAPKPRQRYSNESKRMMTIFESREVLELHCAEVDPLNISLLKLKNHHCRWPYGELNGEPSDEILFCGHQKNDVSSYCGLHFALSRRRMT